MSTFIHLIGPTCAGKSTLIRAALQHAPNDVGTIEVGKLLRAKYGPAYFKGQAAPEHTQDEAWALYRSGIQEHIEKKTRLVFIDGQPRDIKQCHGISQLYEENVFNPQNRCMFLVVHADETKRIERAKSTRTGDDLELALARITNDYRNSYIALQYAVKRHWHIESIDTTEFELEDYLLTAGWIDELCWAFDNFG